MANESEATGEMRSEKASRTWAMSLSMSICKSGYRQLYYSTHNWRKSYFGERPQSVSDPLEAILVGDEL